MAKKPPAPDLLRICDRGQSCPNRNIPLVDVFLISSGTTWLQHLGVSIPFAQQIPLWANVHGIGSRYGEQSAEPEDQRNLFSEVT